MTEGEKGAASLTFAQILKDQSNNKTLKQWQKRFGLDPKTPIPPKTAKALTKWSSLTARRKAELFHQLSKGRGVPSTHASAFSQLPPDRADRTPKSHGRARKARH